jgi:nicotinamide-nucleotide amidase
MQDDASEVGEMLQRRGLSLAVAESLTGGMLASRFARGSAASQWFQGGVIAYSSSVKYDLLRVPHGPVVSQRAAAAMADGVAHLLKATVAIAVTGVGGPDPQDGQPPGTVWVATWPTELGSPTQLHLDGAPDAICEQVCVDAVRMLYQRLSAQDGGVQGHA